MNHIYKRVILQEGSNNTDRMVGLGGITRCFAKIPSIKCGNKDSCGSSVYGDRFFGTVG